MVTIDTKEMARRKKRTAAAITKAARGGRFGDAAKFVRGRWQFDSPRAEAIWSDSTDPARYSVERFDGMTDSTAMVVFEGPRGRLEVTQHEHRALLAAVDHPEQELLSPALVATLDAILFVKGITTSPTHTEETK